MRQDLAKFEGPCANVELDDRVKAMELDGRPTEEYRDIGGCDKQIQELNKAVVFPMTHRDMFETIDSLQR